MNKIIKISLVVIFLLICVSALILSTTGIETKKFNFLIESKIKQSNNNLDLKFNNIRFKFDIKEISLFLQTSNPNLKYHDVNIPVETIKVYIDFSTFLTASAKIKKIQFSVEQLEISKFKKLISFTKPSNFRSLVSNKIDKGKASFQIEFYLNNENQIENFISKGTVYDLSLVLVKDLTFKRVKFNFFADNNDILLKNINGKFEKIDIKEGDLKIQLSPQISLQSNFLSILNLDKNSIKKLIKLNDNNKIAGDLIYLKADLNNNLFIKLNETYKLIDYKFESNGNINETQFQFKKSINNYLSNEKIKEVFIKNSKVSFNLNSKKKEISSSGKYSLDNRDFLKFDFNNNINNKNQNLIINFDYKNLIDLKFINYKKPKNIVSNIFIKFKKNKDLVNINEIKLIENKNSFLVKDMIFKRNSLFSFQEILVKTHKKGKINNDFSIKFGKKIVIFGSYIDATNFSQFFNQKSVKNNFKNLSKNIEIDFKNVKAPLSKNLKNFKLIGFIDKGKFSKISSKGDFGNNKFLDISMKHDKKNKKYLEIYSDLPQPLLTEYSFFKGLVGGNLFFSSIIDGNNSISKLRVENFKVRNAPGMIKLLSLADLGGLADLAEGEGLSFEYLEINMNKDKELTKFDEIIATGSSISVLMEGYQEESGVTSLRGTLIPAKNLNKLISKIPVVGEIIIPKEVGEGLFGISFKMKGPKGEIKTTINPIKTVTPRFLQKIIERKKKSN